jgi:hypothetical protein
MKCTQRKLAPFLYTVRTACAVCRLILCVLSTPPSLVHGSEDDGIEPETVTRFAFGKSDTLASRLDLKNTHVLSAPNKPQPSSFHQLRLTQSQIKFGDL